jgi:hypothetical protein
MTGASRGIVARYLNVGLSHYQALLTKGEMLLHSKELVLQLYRYHRRSHGLRGRRKLV